MGKVNLMTQAAYARHRGVSKVAVGKAVKAGRISLVNGLIDPVVADVQWKANSRARVSQHGGDQLPLDAAGAVDEPVKVDDYVTNRNRTEAATAGRAELALAREMGELISIAAVEAVWANDLAATRDAMLQISPRISAQLAAESDPATIQKLLSAEIHQGLEVISGSNLRIKSLAVSVK